MNTSTIILLVFVISTFSIMPGIAMALESHNSPIKDFFIGALTVPVLGLWSGLTMLILINIPDSIMNGGWAFVIFSAIFIGSPLIGALIFIAIITKFCK
jgi:hypothetical protein